MATTNPVAQNFRFATTRWSVVVSAGHGSDSQDCRQAMEHLCESYWQPLYSYVRRRGYSQDDAQDLTQEFFARLLQNNRIASADQQKGKFRAFLLGAMKNFLCDEWDKSRAKKRGGGIPTLSLHFETGEAVYELEPVTTSTPEEIFERRWALTLLENVLRNLENEYEQGGKGRLFTELRPCLVGERTSIPYSQLAADLGLTEGAIKSTVHRLRARYRELLRQEIANTVATPAEIDEELNFLFTILARRS